MKSNDLSISSSSLCDIALDLEKYLDATNIWRDGTVYSIKKRVFSIHDLEIHIYPKDHHPPHFHVISKQKNIDARFDLHTLEKISNKKGVISINDIKKIKSFFQDYPDNYIKLKKTFENLNPND